jgi:hypothetical protein
VSGSFIDHPHVRVVRSSSEPSYLPAIVPRSRAGTAERFTAWLVILLLAACVGLALYDLYPLLSGLH